jgi:hypothetical protein
MAVAVAQRPDPTLKVGIDNVPLSGTDRFSLSGDFMTMRRIGISQELTRADKLRWRSARLEREADKAQAQKDVALAAIQRDTAISWLNVYYIRKMSVVLTEQVVFSRQEIDAATAAYRRRGSQADVLAARSALLTPEDRPVRSNATSIRQKTCWCVGLAAAANLPIPACPTWAPSL